MRRARMISSGYGNGDADIALCARGGYGAGRILHLIRGQLRSGGPTLVGFSDITYLLSHIAKNKLGKAVHGPLPINLQSPDKIEAFDNLLGCIARDDFSFSWESQTGCLQEGEASGRAIVGNLSILSHLIGTPDEPDWDGAILFVEDVDEYLYAIDRIFLHLASCGILDRIAGLVLGSFTEIKDHETPFALSIDEMALYHLRGRKIPVASGAPFGHGAHNQPIVFGAMTNMLCSDSGVTIKVKG